MGMRCCVGFFVKYMAGCSLYIVFIRFCNLSEQESSFFVRMKHARGIDNSFVHFKGHI